MSGQKLHWVILVGPPNILGVPPTVLNFPEESRSPNPLISIFFHPIFFVFSEQSKIFILSFPCVPWGFPLLDGISGVLPAELLAEDGDTARGSQGFGQLSQRPVAVFKVTVLWFLCYDLNT